MKQRLNTVLFVTLMVLVGCGSTTSVETKSPQYYGLEYQVIDGMPCIRDTSYRQGGISCDWSKWEGRVINNQIVLDTKGE